MPTYEYECKKCGPFEVFQSIKDEKLKRCPTCRSAVKRLMGRGSGILFKGTGFYQTDYRSSGYQSDASAATKSSADANTAAKSSGDAAAATKSSGDASVTKTPASDAGAASKSTREKKR